MTSKLEGAEEQTIGHTSTATTMVDAVSPHDAAKPPKSKEPPHRKAPVHEPIMNDGVRNAEQRHPKADAEGHLATEPHGASATVEDERDGQGRVGNREHVVGLPSTAWPMVAAVNAPESAVPNPSMEDRSPRVHGNGHEQRDGKPNEQRAHPNHAFGCLLR